MASSGEALRRARVSVKVAVETGLAVGRRGSSHHTKAMAEVSSSKTRVVPNFMVEVPQATPTEGNNSKGIG
jgi:transketolase C-terminal domain/subunit